MGWAAGQNGGTSKSKSTQPKSANTSPTLYFPVSGIRVVLVAEQARLSLLVLRLVLVGRGRPTAGTL